MDNLSYILGLNNAEGGGTGSTPTWNEVTGKPFDTVGSGLTVTAGALETVGGSGSTPTWNDVTGKPFSTVDTTTGLTILDNTLMLDTLDTIATIQYVNSATTDVYDSITTTLDAYALTTDIPDVSSFITAEALTPYVTADALTPYITADALTPYAESSSLATVATTGLYSDLTGAPSIPSISATQALTTGVTIGAITIDGTTTEFYAPQGGGATGATPNWTAASGTDGYIENKPDIIPFGDGCWKSSGTSITNDYMYRNHKNCIAFGPSTNLKGNGSYITGAVAIGDRSKATADRAVALGMSNQANANDSFVLGYENTVNGYGAFVCGESHSVPADARDIHVQGKYSVSNNIQQFADVVGNGTANNKRSNAEATDWGGNKYLAGDVYVGVTNWGTTPSVGAAKLPKEVDFSYALQSGLVREYSMYEDALNTYSGGGTDSQGNPEYLGVSSEFSFKCGLDESGNKSYYWLCDYAEPELNPDYNPDEPEPDPEEPEEEPEEP